MVTQNLEEIPDIAPRIRDGRFGWFIENHNLTWIKAQT